ncbi:DNA-binding protein [Pseudactinotalea sp.]|uniref:DNA-binding protein n=1 Tax=Pseudactinotalea sp. TaxID=1926260 RepID=UPI003B3A7665
MPRNHSDSVAASDQRNADRERTASERLRGLGGDRIPAPPWRPATVPHSAVDLVQLALWRSQSLDRDEVGAALSLLPAARAEVDGLETGMLFVARSAGMTWAQIADAMGFNSPQACQQHFQRLAARSEAR